MTDPALAKANDARFAAGLPALKQAPTDRCTYPKAVAMTFFPGLLVFDLAGGGTLEMPLPDDWTYPEDVQ